LSGRGDKDLATLLEHFGGLAPTSGARS
jgi:hypothetical protein